MEIRRLTASLSVSEQLNVEDIEAVTAAGFKTVICNRPDNEGEGQPVSDSIRQACEAQGVNWQYMPVNPKAITDAQGVQFGELLKSVETPVLAFCRTGTRCTNLWELSQAGDLSLEEILASAKMAGYDISSISERVNNIADTKNTHT